MTTNSHGKLPAARLSPVLSNGDHMIQDAVILDIPPSSKFSFSWPDEPNRSSPTTLSAHTTPGSSEGRADISEGESGGDYGEMAYSSDPPSFRPKSQWTGALPPPRLPHSLSMPLLSQLGHLQNPHRRGPVLSRELSPDLDLPEASQFRELSLELADSVQMAIQTMLQISPSQVLDPAKEQVSACSLSVPTTSISAIFTTLKNLNYISANMATFCVGSPREEGDSSQLPGLLPVARNDFDIGEMLQSVGDALSGAAGQVGVDLVLYHGDVGMRHISVRGDESGISFALSHVVRQVLSAAQRGDSIELGLFLEFVHPRESEYSSNSDPEIPVSDDDYRSSASPVELDDPLQCTIRISHKFGSSEPMSPGSVDTTPTKIRSQPSFSTHLLSRILGQVGARFTPDLPPPQSFTAGRTYDLVLTLERGPHSTSGTPATLTGTTENDPFTGEPTLEQLTAFAETLRGKRVTLYASSKGSFAQHLTSYLTAWGMDVSHVSPEGSMDDHPEPFSMIHNARLNAINPMLSTYRSNTDGPPTVGVPPKVEARQSSPQPLSFIFIDDDIDVLHERLQALRTEQVYPLNLNTRKRPSLAAHHRPRSTSQVARASGNSSTLASVVILHFTSLTNYKIIQDLIQSVLASYSGSTSPIPEIMIIPKPAGPRRFLTALHTAVKKPFVDPCFTPIATSPSSPGVYSGGSFFHTFNTTSQPSPKMPSSKSPRPAGSRSNSDRSTRSMKDSLDHPSHPPPSPLGMSDNVEYFSEAAAKLGTSPSSGLVIQSPDGQPAGIFFHPRGKNQRHASSHTMERDKGQLYVPSERKRSSSRGAPDSSISFSALPGSNASPKVPQPSLDAKGPSSLSKISGKKPVSPRMEESISIPSPTVPPNLSEMMRKLSTPPGSPLVGEASAPVRRATPRRVTQETKEPTSAASAAKKGVKPAADGNIVPPISVLIVDDNPINQTILSTFMKKKRIKYDLANNGQEAVQKWRTGEFHLILMDIQMPVMDGIQATKEIRRLEKVNACAGYPPSTPSLEEPRTPPIRTPSDTSTEARSASSPYRSSVIIVALTASSLQSDRVAALAAGCNDFLTKPVSLLWLNNKIIEWGSIKALQMWADLRPDVVKNISTGQTAQARNVAERLHVPKGRATPSPSRRPSTSYDIPAAMVASSGKIAPSVSGVPTGAGRAGMSVVPMSSTSPAYWSAGQQQSPAAFWGGLGVSAETLNKAARNSLAQPPPAKPNAQSSEKLSSDHATEADDTPKPDDHGTTDLPSDIQTSTLASVQPMLAPTQAPEQPGRDKTSGVVLPPPPLASLVEAPPRQ